MTGVLAFIDSKQLLPINFACQEEGTLSSNTMPAVLRSSYFLPDM